MQQPPPPGPPPPPPRPPAGPLLTSSNGKHRTVRHPPQLPAANDDANAADLTPADVVGRIEEFVHAWLTTLTTPGVEGPPTFEVMRRTKRNTVYNAGGGAEDGEGGTQQYLPGLVHGDGRTVRKLKGNGARPYAAIFATLAFAHRLLLSGQVATSREFWYVHKTSHQCFRSQAECDDAVLDTASLLGVSRHQLGILGAAKGLLAGRFRFRVWGSGREWTECGGGGEGGVGGSLIDSSWITEVMALECAGGQRPRYVVVVEKESVFNRLLGDGLLDQAGGVIMVTGKGYPDLATRACVKALVEAYQVPVVGLCDCNPHGIGLLLTYKCGSFRMPESQAYRVPLCWLGLRPLQILQRLDLPDDCFQVFSEGDVGKAESLATSSFCDTHPRWKEEVEAMATEHLKCELEALNAHFGDGNKRDFLCQFVVRALLLGDYLA